MKESEKKIDPDESYVKYAIHGNFVAQAITSACKLNIFEYFVDDTVSLDINCLAGKISANAYSLEKLVRFLVLIELLDYSETTQEYKITKPGKLLRKNNVPSFYSFALMHGSRLFRGASSFLAESVKNNKSGTSYFCDKEMFEYLAENPDESTIFNNSMSNLTNVHANEIAKLIENLRVKTIIDAGGGIGTLICSILQHNPNLNGTIVDLPNLKDEALKYIANNNLSQKIKYYAGSFFEKFEPIADVITLHHVLHDYNDDDCIKILKNCKDSLTPDGSIVVIETILGTDPKIGIGWLKDLILHVTTPGGGVRKKTDFESIATRAGLKIKQIHPIKYCDLSGIQLSPLA